MNLLRCIPAKARPVSVALFAASLILWGHVGAGAHHGWANYDESRAMNVTGVIREAAYENPHGYARLEVEGTVWLVILAPPARMQRRGLTREMLQVGTTATVVGYPHRRIEGEMRAERITIDGRTVELR